MLANHLQGETFAKPFCLVVNISDPHKPFYAQGKQGKSVDDPNKPSRVFAADVNSDGKLDLLVGDATTLYYPAEGVSDEDARAAYKKYLDAQMEYSATYPGEGDQEEIDAWMEGYQKLEEDRDKVVRVEMTGFVWVYHQK